MDPDPDQEKQQSHTEESRIAAAKRDPSLFAGLYEDNFYRVYAYVARRVTDRATAEDLVSEVFREALVGLAKFEWQGVPFVAWLLKIASRSIADHYVRYKREALDIEPTEPNTGDLELAAMLYQLVDRLPETQYQVIHMRFVEQKSVREIAQTLGRTEGAVKQLQFRAVETLRSQWGAIHA
jgi:RNA polymerase sigma-70 factor (ECF subfamily)